MTRNLKILGMLLASMFAITATAAATASAASFHSEVEPTYLTSVAVGNQVLSVSGAEAVCTSLNLSGSSATKTSGSVTVHPNYSNCEFLGEEAIVDTEGCDYKLSANGLVEIVCAGTSKIKVTTGACTLSIGSQLTIGGATYGNGGSGSSRDIGGEVETNMGFTKSGPLCFLVSGNTGTYTGWSTLRGYSDSAHTKQVGIWHS